MQNRYFLMRHGESQANRADLIISDPEVGCRLYGLTPKGSEQAREAGLKSGLREDTIILCSDFLRTRETAEIVSQVLGCSPPLPEEGLRERFFGELEGTSGKGYLQVWHQDTLDSGNTPYGAESPRHLCLRLQKLMRKLEQAYTDQTLLLVSHGDTLRYLQLVMSKRPLVEHLEIRLFDKAEIRPLEELPKPKQPVTTSDT